MRFFASASALLAFAASAVAQTADFNPIYAPKAGEVITAGSPFTITWRTTPKYANEKITISLSGGASQLQQVPITTIATGVDNSRESYSWNVDSSLGDAAVYSLVMRLESNPAVFQYSNSFQIKGNGKKSSASATHSMKTTHTSSYAPSVTVQPNVTASYNMTTMTRNATTVCVVCNTTTMSATSRTFVTTTSWTSPSVTAPSVTSTPVVGAASIVGAGSWGALAALAVAFFAL